MVLLAGLKRPLFVVELVPEVLQPLELVAERLQLRLSLERAKDEMVKMVAAAITTLCFSADSRFPCGRWLSPQLGDGPSRLVSFRGFLDLGQIV